MLLPLEVLIRLFRLLERKDLVVQHRMDVVGLYRPIHILELQPRAHKQAADGAQLAQTVQQRRLLFVRGASEEADDGDDAIDLDGLERLQVQ